MASRPPTPRADLIRQPFRNAHIIVNPASGQDEPVLSLINDVFAEFEIPWEAHVTHAFGDATRLAAEAVDAGADVIISYGGDGTLMEVVNGVMGRSVPIGLLPGGTGNGVATELKIPEDTAEALRVIAASGARRRLDVGRTGDHHFLLRAYIGLPADYNPPRDVKDRLGLLAYPVYALRLLKERPPVHYHITVDDVVFDGEAVICLVNNVGYSNSPQLADLVQRLFLDVKTPQHLEVNTEGQSIQGAISPTDGKLDVVLLTNDPFTLGALASLVIGNGESGPANVYFLQGKRIVIEAEPPQAMRLDGEEGGTTPCEIEVVPQVVEVIVPEAPPAAE